MVRHCRRIWRRSRAKNCAVCAACRAAFATLNKKERAAAVHDAATRLCGCEEFKAVPGSPGQVQDHELLHLLVSDPLHVFQETGELRPELALQIDRGGLSVLRSDAEDDEFRDTLDELRRKSTETGKERFFHGVITFKARDVRYRSAERFLCIYDTFRFRRRINYDQVGAAGFGLRDEVFEVRRMTADDNGGVGRS